jgi:hypothetical protein
MFLELGLLEVFAKGGSDGFTELAVVLSVAWDENSSGITPISYLDSWSSQHQPFADE